MHDPLTPLPTARRRQRARLAARHDIVLSDLFAMLRSEIRFASHCPRPPQVLCYKQSKLCLTWDPLSHHGCRIVRPRPAMQ
ncbi:hypothetical protein PUNSTDRAFT_55036 [Punctularia strigosozonata HHB-11173 SS5]|uniref:Uncharacterized protein n=1 Tax=Punctularia strigosozonata (strain HHB-11173) TaxID=741275 RepID=R7S5C3_PUNST|nr:uncharacterized protein PUNSTDRAFT_55036 [Punctularia strigosozonata HHB-11173 SS5]EIN05112.1 hypothetical protein PUNSTDRAFT_55036 [Punctularia strigosozonata HHB-11173 SS5]